MSVSESNSSKSVTSYVSLNLLQIFADEEEDNIVYSIREEIIQNVLKETDRISQESRMVNLVTECACEALRKLISIHFYYHVENIMIEHPEWAADDPTAPCPPDTWAIRNVPVRPQPRQVIKQDEELSTTPEVICCTCELGIPCLCHLSSEERIKEQIDILYTPEVKTVRKSTASKHTGMDDVVVEDENLPVEEAPSETMSDEKESVPCVLKEGFSKIGICTRQLKLPKIELPVPTFRHSETNVLELPPIRIAATFQAIAQEPTLQDKQKRDKKKKKREREREREKEKEKEKRK